VHFPFLTTLLLLALAAIFAACGRSDEEIAELRTGFETRAGSEWTSLSEEESFLRELDAASDRVRISEIGRSVEGRPIRLITVGDVRTPAEVARGSSVLFVCSQHGSEPAGREACLQAARDAAIGDLDSTVLLIPTANPDGSATSERHNADGVDINRDHAELTTPEAEAVAGVIRDYKPDLLGDMHEYQEPGASKVLLSNPDRLHRNVDPRIQELSSRLNRYAESALAAAELETGIYPSSAPEANEGVMRQQAALRHSASLLVETPRLGTLSPVERVAAQRVAMSAMFKLLGDKRREIAATTAAAAQSAADEGAGGGDDRYYYTSPETYSDTPPCGYTVSDDEYREIERQLDLHGITATSTDGSWTIPTAQPAEPMVGLLLDERAPRRLVNGEPVPC
jgi:predicted deacylase